VGLSDDRHRVVRVERRQTVGHVSLAGGPADGGLGRRGERLQHRLGGLDPSPFLVGLARRVVRPVGVERRGRLDGELYRRQRHDDGRQPTDEGRRHDRLERLDRPSDGSRGGPLGVQLGGEIAQKARRWPVDSDDAVGVSRLDGCAHLPAERRRRAFVGGVVDGQWDRKRWQFECEHVRVDRVDYGLYPIRACGVVVEDADEDDPADALDTRLLESRVARHPLGPGVRSDT